tara:strand:- start:154 stop:558 length:405 start_codon:yes stop_codon:yes gene_type:complete
MPNDILKFLSIDTFVESIKPILSFILIISVAMLLGALIAKIGFLLGGFLSIWLKTFQFKNRLKDLTKEEKEILISYLDNDTRSRRFNMTHGVVQGLVHEKILYQSTIMASGISQSYNIQPWAWKYLKKNRNLLE